MPQAASRNNAAHPPQRPPPREGSTPTPTPRAGTRRNRRHTRPHASHRGRHCGECRTPRTRHHALRRGRRHRIHGARTPVTLPSAEKTAPDAGPPPSITDHARPPPMAADPPHARPPPMAADPPMGVADPAMGTMDPAAKSPEEPRRPASPTAARTGKHPRCAAPLVAKLAVAAISHLHPGTSAASPRCGSSLGAHATSTSIAGRGPPLDPRAARRVPVATLLGSRADFQQLPPATARKRGGGRGWRRRRLGRRPSRPSRGRQGGSHVKLAELDYWYLVPS
ncbi:hypothetical protein PVAP13_3NG266302 [Panicum virgatum]|uniref:Uncharacterized protein n=1 Tax=Panicum virgatum TaxID=38727 RepID=A0A8T0UNM5_PANVG|nr:hypothetical protein PVAP13_3NG266302 [Panicum virgatum]